MSELAGSVLQQN